MSKKHLRFNPLITLSIVLALCLALSCERGALWAQDFRRGDANSDGVLSLPDVISILDYISGLGDARDCADAMDVNDDGSINIVDPIFQLVFLFAGGQSPMAPYPFCGSDPTSDSLNCDNYPASVCP